MMKVRWARGLIQGLLIILWLGAGWVVGRGVVANGQKVNPEARILKEFTDRVQAYVKLQKRVAAGLPPLKGKADPVRIAAYQEALAQAIREARSEAKPGDIFSPEIKSYFLRTLRRKLPKSSASSARAAVMEDNPKKVPLRVNDRYPESEPLSTVPPSLLLELPRLPEEVEYRFVNRHLILRDRKANLIVDFILEAIP